MVFRFARFALGACLAALIIHCADVIDHGRLLPPVQAVVHADRQTGSCNGAAHADASSYDGSLAGSADNSVSAGGYTLGDCAGLGQTNAIFTAGTACDNAGIPAGQNEGIGSAVVTWLVVWLSDSPPQQVVIGPIQQQYDCGDTFS